MDAFNIFLVTLLACGASASPMVDDANEELKDPAEITTRDANSDTTLTPPLTPEPRNCSTAREEAGNCIARQLCDYGTPAIDRTLYAQKGYVKLCTPEEVCCPYNSILKPPVSQPTGNDEGFDFNEDD